MERLKKGRAKSKEEQAMDEAEMKASKGHLPERGSISLSRSIWC